jgi:hypothetical protein
MPPTASGLILDAVPTVSDQEATMSHQRIVLTTLIAAAALVATPAATAHAARSQAPPPPPPLEDPDPGAGGDAVVYPEGYPVAVLEMPLLARPGRLTEVVLDDSTGDIVAQELRIEDADGHLMLVIGYDRPPGPDCWLAFSLREPGWYTATLTVTSPEGYTDSVSQPFLVFEIRLPEL